LFLVFVTLLHELRLREYVIGLNEARVHVLTRPPTFSHNIDVHSTRAMLHLPTKDDLKTLATKEDVIGLKEEMEGLKADMQQDMKGRKADVIEGSKGVNEGLLKMKVCSKCDERACNT
jgi:hypothetical protein